MRISNERQAKNNTSESELNSKQPHRNSLMVQIIFVISSVVINLVFPYFYDTLAVTVLPIGNQDQSAFFGAVFFYFSFLSINLLNLLIWTLSISFFRHLLLVATIGNTVAFFLFGTVGLMSSGHHLNLIYLTLQNFGFI